MNVVEKVTKDVEGMGACNKFHGHTLDNLIDQLFTPQGVEWVMAHAYPTMEMFRKFKPMHPDKKGVFIDCGKVILSQPEKVFLIGDTHAELTFSATKAFEVRLMYGATATIHASGYAVVQITKDRLSKVDVHAIGRARVLQ